MEAVNLNLFEVKFAEFRGRFDMTSNLEKVISETIERIHDKTIDISIADKIISAGEFMISSALFPKDNPFEHISDFDHIEIFTIHNGQQVWSTDCLKKISSYSEEEWRSSSFDILYSRPLPIVQKIHQYVNDAINTGETLQFTGMDHTIIETKSNREFYIELGYIAPLYDVNMRPLAVLTTCKSNHQKKLQTEFN